MLTIGFSHSGAKRDKSSSTLSSIPTPAKTRISSSKGKETGCWAPTEIAREGQIEHNLTRLLRAQAELAKVDMVFLKLGVEDGSSSVLCTKLE